MSLTAKRYALLAGFFLLAVFSLALVVDHSFFSIPSGLRISNTVLPWQPSMSYVTAFAAAATNTLVVGVLSIIFCTVIGVAVGLIGVSKNASLQLPYNLYVGAFRNVPILFVILLFYFVGITLPGPADAIDVFGGVYLSNRGVAMPALTFNADAGIILPAVLLLGAALALLAPLRWSLRLLASLSALVLLAVVAFDVSEPALGKFGFRGGFTVPMEFAVLTFALSIYFSAEIAEITRGSILSINTGLVDAAQALGLRTIDRFRLVLAPLAFRFGLPSALNTYVVVLKSTSLGIAIGYTELFSVARLSIAASGRVLECLALLALCYLTICGSASLLANLVTDRLKERTK